MFDYNFRTFKIRMNIDAKDHYEVHAHDNEKFKHFHFN